MMKRLLTILSICVLCITAQAQIVIGVTRTGQVGTADQNLEFVDQFGRIMAYPSLGPTGELLDAMRPAVATNLNVSDVTKVSATTGGKVIAEGASAVTECGVCFSTSTNPTTQDAHVTATPDADGNFTVSLTGLQPNTTYHVRAYATNAIGTSYGTDFTFTTRGDANITITGNTDTKTYNGAQQSVTGYTVTIPDGVNIAASEISGPTVTAQGTDVGTYTMSLTAGDFSCSNTNYDVTFTVANGVSLTITRATATVTADAQTKVYGTAEPSFTATVTGLQGNDAASSITYSVTRATGENVGTYAITPSGAAEQGNYNVTYVPANLTITKASATVTPDAKSKTYGAADPELTATVSGTVGSDVLNYTLSRTAGENAGTYAITATPGDNPNYNVTVVPGTLTITKATATVTADNATKVYGAADPTFTATVTGVQSGDQLNYTLARATGENAGTYAINVTLGDNPNYEVTTAAGTFTITKATATVTANNASKVYGATDPTFTATVTGVQSGDQLNYTLARVTGENAGTYAITVTLGSNPNYEVTATNGTFTINKATATVTAADKSKTYGTSDPELTATVTGAVNNETLNYTLARVTGENAGTYAINVTLGDNPNYEVTTTAGTFTITKATATVTADAKTKVYGVPDPTFTATVTGVQSGDQLNYTLARVTGENAGTYAINVTLGDNPNYEVTTTAGTFTITKAPATVTAVAATKEYGAADPTFTATVTGLKNNDDASVINYTLSRAAGEDAGTYAITPTGEANQGNYTVTYVPADFTITPAAATVTASAKEKVYGETDPTFTATISGLRNPNDASQITYSLSRVSGQDVGTYTITPTGATTQGNYTVAYQTGTFTITPAPATVTAVAATKEYGAADPTFTATVTGLKRNDQPSVLNYSLSRATGETVGTYAITPTGEANQGNYTVIYVPADFTITPAAATVTADDKTKVAGESDPQFTATVTGLQNGETSSVLTYTFSRETGEDVGTYTITPTGATTQGNYTVAYQTGTLTITEPACPTLGATTYTPDPVTGNTITLNTPVNNVATGVTVSNPQYTALMGTTPVTVSNVNYNNGTMTGTITITTAMRNQSITVTPSIAVTGCSNPGTITGDAVEICVQPVMPSFGTVTNTNGTGKANLFKRNGVVVYFTINDYDPDLVQEMGFYISKERSEVENHTCSTTAATLSSVDIHSYNGAMSLYTDQPENVDVYNTTVGMTHCGVTTYYQPYMIVNLCGETVTLYGNDIKSFGMWGPESQNSSSEYFPTISAAPSSTISSGESVQLSASSYITYTNPFSSRTVHETIEDAFHNNAYLLSLAGISNVSVNNWSYYWKDEDGNLLNTPGYNQGTITVSPTHTTTYTAYGDFYYNGEHCVVSKSVTVTVTP